MVKKLITFPPVALALEMAHTYIRVGVARSAAALSYFLILTLFPMLLCVNYFIGLFHLDLEQLLTALDQLLPAHLAWAWDTAVTWVALDAYPRSFEAWDDLGLTWAQLDGVSRQDLENGFEEV